MGLHSMTFLTFPFNIASLERVELAPGETGCLSLQCLISVMGLSVVVREAACSHTVCQAPVTH